MKLSTYTIVLDGRHYAAGMDFFGEKVFSIETGKHVDGVRTAAERDAAIMAVCQPREGWRDAYNAARAAGNYIGQLIPDDMHAFPVMEV